MKKNLITLLLTLPFLSNGSDPGRRTFSSYSDMIDEITEANITVVHKHNENFYGAFLKNGDVVTASEGPAGEYRCSRHDYIRGKLLPLRSDKKYFDMLKRIYNKLK